MPDLKSPDIKLPRLLAAAKEFNIGQETLVEFLYGKGFSRDDLKPTAKLTEDMYRALQQEFQSDKVAKTKADQIEIPKSVQSERKKKDEEEITFKKDKEEVKPSAPPPPPPPAQEPEPQKPEVNVKEEVPVAEAPAPEAPAAPPVKESEVTKIEAPQIETPKVLDKIDLSTIESSTRPKKSEGAKASKPKEPVAEEPTSIPDIPVVAEAPVVKEDIPAPVEAMQRTQETVGPIIENIKADKIEGLKIIRKIELPVDSDTRPKPASKEEKRKRKRIPIEPKTVQRTDTRPDGGGFNRGPGAPSDGRSGGGPSRFSVPRVGHQAEEEESRLHAMTGERRAQIKKLTKKKYRKRSGKRRQNLPVHQAGAKALKLNTAGKNGRDHPMLLEK